jgi:thiol-disulfide isomerase/thioredoxin
MKRIYIGLIFGLFFTSVTQAKELQLDDQYAVFGGEPVSLKAAIGKKPVYMKFWATWCLECRQELPHLEQTYQKYRDKLAIYAVNLNINETDEYIKKLQQKHTLTIPIVMDNNGSIAGNFQFQGTPFHVLIDATGKVVYTTYKDDEALEKNLAQLASHKTVAVIDNSAQIEKSAVSKSQTKGLSVVYLATTWCDWYMKDIHPEMSGNCINATQVVNDLYRQKPEISLQSYVSHLWTDEKYLNEYKEKFAIKYPVTIDSNGAIARHYQTTEYPTLLVFNNGKEIGRLTRFNKPAEVMAEITKLLNSK